MLIVTEVYDDEMVDVTDTCTLNVSKLNKQGIFEVLQYNEIYGICVYNNNIEYAESYVFTGFVYEEEAIEYMLNYGESSLIKVWDNDLGYWLVLQKKCSIIHVDYFVCYYLGDEVCYLGKQGYTPYIQFARPFDRATAQRQAAIMRAKSKTGKYWTVERVEMEH